MYRPCITQLSCTMAALAAATGVLAQPQATAWPERPIRMIVPFAPGGASDIVGRIISPRLSQELGQQVVIDNRAGASGNVGVEIASRAAPDGYTVLLGNIGTMAINPAIFPDFPVRPVRDFVGVSQIVDVPGAMVAHPSVPANTVREFIAYAKSHPGKLNFGSSGAGSAGRLEMEAFMRMAGITLVHIPYKGGAGAATAALLAGEIAVVNVSLAAVLPQVRAGKLKALGVAAIARPASLPDVPTMAESGFKEMTTGSWQGVYFPAGTPRPIVNRMFKAATKTVVEPEVTRRLNDAGAEVIVSASPEAFATFMRAQNERWAKVVKTIGLIGE
jgi:tripartite-type tricarboxylate transporter receptor subunit TctC